MEDITVKKRMIKRNLINIDSLLFIFLIVIFLLPIKISAADLPPVQISTTNPPTYYETLQDAYNHANTNDVIKSKNTTFDSLSINRDTSVTFQGGYNSDFSSIIGNTYINGIITIDTGTTVIGNFKIVSLPVIIISSPIPGATNINAPRLIYSACCGTTVVKVDDIVVSKVSGDILDLQPDGQHFVRIDATDSVGNPIYATVTFTVDTVTPAVTILSPVSGLTKTNNPVLNYTVSDGNVVVKLDGAIIPIANGSNLGILTDGPHVVRVESTDLANNTGSAEVTFNLDTAGTGAPVIAILSPVSGITKTINPLLNYTVSDGTVVVKVDGVVVNKTSGDLLDALTDGVHAVRIEATNTFNSRAVEVAFTVDTTPPTVAITSPSSGVTNNDTPTLTYTVSDGNVVVKLDGVIVPVANGSSLGLLADGSHTIWVGSTDLAGNIGFAQVSFSIDTSSNNGPDPDASNAYCNGTEQYIAGESAFTSGMSVPVGANEILIDLPIDGSTIDGSKLIVKGAMDTTISVNKVIVQVSNPNVSGTTSYIAQVNGNYFAAKITLADGANTITAISYDINGEQHQANVSVYVITQSNSVALSATPSTGIPTTQQNGQTALDVVLQGEPALSNAATSYTWDFNGSGSNQLKCYTHSSVGAKYQHLGLYLARVTATDTLGNRYSDSVIVNLLDYSTMNNFFTSHWNAMRNELAGGNIAGALSHFNQQSRDVYNQQFIALAPYLAQIVGDMGSFNLITMKDRIAEGDFRLFRDGEIYSFQALFYLDDNGDWGIRSF